MKDSVRGRVEDPLFFFLFPLYCSLKNPKKKFLFALWEQFACGTYAQVCTVFCLLHLSGHSESQRLTQLLRSGSAFKFSICGGCVVMASCVLLPILPHFFSQVNRDHTHSLSVSVHLHAPPATPVLCSETVLH